MESTIGRLAAWETEPALRTRQIAKIETDSENAKWFVRAEDKQGRDVYLVRPDFDRPSAVFVSTVREAASIMKARRVGWRVTDDCEIVRAVVAKYEMHGKNGGRWALEATHTV